MWRNTITSVKTDKLPKNHTDGTNLYSLSNEQLVDFGWVEEDSPSYDPRYQRLDDDFNIIDMSLQDIKNQRNNEVTQLRNSKRTSGFEFDGVRYDSKPDSPELITGMMTRLLIDDSITEIRWTAEDNSITTMDVATFKQFAITASNFVSMLFEVGRYHKDSIDALETIQDVLDYDINVNW